MSDKILGSWTQSKHKGETHGLGLETYFADGTKTSKVTLFQKSKEPKVISAKSTWRLKNRTLTEEVVSIDKAFSEKFGIKAGFKLISSVISLSDTKMELKPLGFNSNNIIYYKAND